MNIESTKPLRDSAPVAFWDGLVEGVTAPFKGESPKAKSEASGSTLAAGAESAGRMVGSAALFMGTTFGLGRIACVGRLAPYLAGGALGFAEAGSESSLQQRFAFAALGAGTVGMISHGGKGVGEIARLIAPSLESSALVGESALARGYLLPAMAKPFVHSAIASAGVGALNIQADSLIRHGQLAGAGTTALSAASWMGAGMFAHGVGAAVEKLSRSGRMTLEQSREGGSNSDAQNAARAGEAPNAVANATRSVEQVKLRPDEFEYGGASQKPVLVHISEDAQIALKDTNPGRGTKPDGLWYSPGHGWARTAGQSAPELLGRNAFMVDLAQANVLRLSTRADLEQFQKRYSYDADPTSKAPLDRRLYIRWSDVARDYDGIEFANVRRHERSAPAWYQDLWTDSGVLWNATKSSITPLGTIPSPARRFQPAEPRAAAANRFDRFLDFDKSRYARELDEQLQRARALAQGQIG